MRCIYFLCITIFVFDLKIAGAQGPKTPTSKIKSFKLGEELEYKVRFSIFTVGKATVKIDDQYHMINSKLCYNVNAYGRTNGWISWLSKVDDVWGAYLNAETLLPEVAYRKLKEGKYYRDELVIFNHQASEVTVKYKKEMTDEYQSQNYKIPQNTKDLVSGFFHLRTIDFNNVHEGDTISISGFYEDQIYSLSVIFVEREVIRTSLGKIPTFKLRPVIPNNSLFDGKNSVLCWISDDFNHIPVRVQAKMFIGSAGLELVGVRNLRNQLKVISK